MSRSKQQRFAEFMEMQNAFDMPDRVRGQWKERLGNQNSITLELAAGKGDYSLQMGKMHPDRNFIAVDIQGERLWLGAMEGLENKQENVSFLRIPIDHILEYFEPCEVDEIWIVFPDPHPREGKAKKRLSSPRFLARYKEIIKKGGKLHFKTDNLPLFEYTMETLSEEGATIHQEIRDIYSKGKLPAELEIKTYFEKKHLRAGRKINYVCFSL